MKNVASKYVSSSRPRCLLLSSVSRYTYFTDNSITSDRSLLLDTYLEATFFTKSVTSTVTPLEVYRFLDVSYLYTYFTDNSITSDWSLLLDTYLEATFFTKSVTTYC